MSDQFILFHYQFQQNNINKLNRINTKKGIYKNLEHIEISHYEIYRKKFYGKGQFGAIYGCLDQQNPNLQLCAKVLKLEYVDQLILKREVEIIQVLMSIQRENKNLIQVFECLYNHGTLSRRRSQITFGQNKNQPFTIEEAVKIVAQIANGYKTLYKCRIIHRDIKPANILISNGVFKITCLGMRLVIKDMNYAQNFNTVGTLAYAAPQLFLESKFSSKADVYSLGVIFYSINLWIITYIGQYIPGTISKIKRSQKKHQNNVMNNVQQGLYHKILENQFKRCFIMMKMKDIISKSNNQQTPIEITRPKLQSQPTFAKFKNYYRVNDISENKILQIICILATISDLANICHKYLQEQSKLYYMIIILRSGQNFFLLKQGELIFLSLSVSEYRYELMQNILGLLINQYFQLNPELQQIISPYQLHENYQINDVNSKTLKEYIQRTLNTSILFLKQYYYTYFQEDECKFFNSGFKRNIPEVKQLKKVLEQDDDTNYLFFAKKFSFLLKSFQESFSQNLNEPNNKKQYIQRNYGLLNLLNRMNILETQFSIMESLRTRPADILQYTKIIS
ncbi:unnamed protein product [Paramecium pentaurelia]|uniref:Protein kinase domain-containing protein n=1 Tax=Paramecium pentaurelia TaxID=43138 RepID=A0A8S1YLB4_9CILI|nr:unnamed protein product [Paramecium pentaurelia]